MRSRGVPLALALLLSVAPLALVVAATPSPRRRTSTIRAPTAALTGVVVINEVAWGGTQFSPADEWIELVNTTATTIDLSGWRLTAADGSPSITLAGEIAPNGFYLIERTDDDTVSDIPADLICSFGYGLSNEGERLLLWDASGILVDSANGDGGPWPNDGEGGPPSYRSLERLTPLSPDEDDAWVSNDGLTTNGLDAEGTPLNGTPRAPNSATVMPSYADLAVQMHGPAVVTSTTPILYRITLANHGPHTATGVTLIDYLPKSTVLISQTSTFPFASTPSTVTWKVPDLDPGFTSAFTVSLRLQSPITAVDRITNSIAITAATFDGNPANNEYRWDSRVGEPRLLISGVLYDGYQYRDADEAVQVANVGTASEQLEGWCICKDSTDDLRCSTIPPLLLAPGSTAWLARDAAAFTVSFGFAPDRELASWPLLANDGDEVMLYSPSGRVVDTLVYGEGKTTVPGWSGAPLRYYYNHLLGQSGQILHRRLSEATGLPVADTNTALDWMQTLEDVDGGRQVQYPGWDTDTLYHPAKGKDTGTVIVGVAPDNAFDVISQTLLQARRTISIEVYSLRHPQLIDLLATKAAEGVRVTVLLEGDPVGMGLSSPEWQTQLYACQALESAGGDCWYMIHRPEDYVFNRYQHVHAKMIIVDDTWVALSTQNLTQGGLPADPKANGTYGSRGAVLVTDAPTLVQRAAEIFRLDFDPAHHRDLLHWNTGYLDRYGAPDPALVDLMQTDGVSYTVRFSEPLVISGTFEFEFFTAPDAALRRSDALLGVIGRAGPDDEIYIEQLYEPHAWGPDPEADPNVRLRAYIEAAQRGARVRILLNSRSFIDGDSGTPESALNTAQYVNTLALREGLNLRCALGNPTGDGIHNKMILLDLHNDGRYVHLGSINGTETSSKVNREVAVQIRSDEAYAYLLQVFLTDWSLSNPLFLPVMMQGYSPPPPPADHILISEVAYTEHRDGEWIELYNPTDQAIDLSTYKLGDAETPEVFEAMFRFPPGTTMASQTTLVIAINAAAVPSADLEFYESTSEVANMLPYPAWGTTEYPLALRNEGDHVLLLGPDDGVVDVVVWGDRSYPGVTPHPGVTTEGASLERYPAHIDTDNCAVDFRERYPPTPNRISPVLPAHAQP
ncbi:MAG: lamin tail domain-containing protein [Anaerolineae bacterium]